MCEFCSFGPNDERERVGGRDRIDPNFAGFFSFAAIEEAVQQSKKNLGGDSDDDDDGEGDDDSDGT